MSYFVKESFFYTHECIFYLMTLDANQHQFLRTETSMVVPELVFTVEGGRDERPRNKSRTFVLVFQDLY